jgi:hypothetical protein
VSEICGLAMLPTTNPPSTGAKNPPKEFKAPPKFKRELAPSELPKTVSIGFTTAFRIHIENPEINAPNKLNKPTLPAKNKMSTPTKPAIKAVSADFCNQFFQAFYAEEFP